jgi:cellobiose-specific phosphotransferase system component IIA
MFMPLCVSTAVMRALVTGDSTKAGEARERAAQALAKAQNISVEDARTQVTQYEQQYRQAVDEAKRQSRSRR